MEEIHFVGLTSPTNVYSSSTFHCFDRTSVVVGSRTQVQIITPSTTPEGGIVWANDELALPYFSVTEDTIVSVNAFVHNQYGYPVVGITGVRPPHKGSKGFLSIHIGKKTAIKDRLYEFECFVLDLNFVPFKLTHSEVLVNNAFKKVFILSGNDELIHIYSDDQRYKEYMEVPIGNFFPEIEQTASSVTGLDIQYCGNLRITVLGYQSGFVNILVVNGTSVAMNESTLLDGPISCVKAYSPSPSSRLSKYLSHTPKLHPWVDDFKNFSNSEREGEVKSDMLNLVVTGALGYVIVYRDFLNQGLGRATVLPYPQSSDCVTSVCALDWDMDHRKEVCVGSYGKRVYIFKELGDAFKLVGRFNFPQPVEAILPCDATQDGLLGLSVSCFSGVHFIRPALSIVRKKLEEGIELINEKRTLDRLIKEEQEKQKILKLQLGET